MSLDIVTAADDIAGDRAVIYAAEERLRVAGRPRKSARLSIT